LGLIVTTLVKSSERNSFGCHINMLLKNRRGIHRQLWSGAHRDATGSAIADRDVTF